MKGGGHTEKSTATVIGAVTVALIVAAASFYAGTQYQSRKQPTMMGLRGGFQNSGRGLNGGGNRTGFRPVAGEITKVDDSSITVKLQDGSSKIVVVSDSTDINKADKVTRAELKEGKKKAGIC